MQKKWNWLIGAVAGGIYGCVPIGLAQLLIRKMGALAQLVEADEQVYQALAQLEDAALVSPWIWFCLIFALAGAGIGRKKRRIWAIAVLCIAALLLLVPLTAVALWFTQVNSIQTGALIKVLLPLLE